MNRAAKMMLMMRPKDRELDRRYKDAPDRQAPRMEYTPPEDALRRRRRYEDGRFAPMRSDYEVYDQPDSNADRPAPHTQNRLYPMGFTAGPDRYEPAHAHGGYEGEGYLRRGGDGYQFGGAIRPRGEQRPKGQTLDRQTAEQWVSQMSKPGRAGERGGKWSFDEAKALLDQKGWALDPAAFFAAINMLYSDYGKTLAKYNASNVDLYADLARDWLEDDDTASGPNKAACYYWSVIR